MSDPGSSRTHAGKDTRGRWITNDATAEQFGVGVVAFLRDLARDVYRAHPEAVEEAEERLDFLQACAELIEAGERPGRKDGD